ncbi:FAD-dependent monooxygenase [Streptosporangium sp. NPDC001681]|uniref:FAD-dependent monooxygenase n=1 Tax=Streptosporangium sp. NPDC001681 TaxID=3154395 RepID=UPI00332A251B
MSSRDMATTDGMHSTVREQAGIEFEGGQYAESFSLADVRLTGGVPDDEVVLYFAPAGLVVVAPLPDGTHRIVSTVDEAPRDPDVAFVQGLLDTRGARRGRAVVGEVVWGTRFRVHHRVARTFRAGRVLLAGDAAHVHSPAGGQGVDIDIPGATALAEALTIALSGGRVDLDRYTADRRPVTFAGRLSRLANMHGSLRPIRNLVLRALAISPAFRRRLAWRLSGLVHR